MRVAMALLAMVSVAGSVVAEDLGGGGFGSNGLVPRLEADHWVPGQPLTLRLSNLPTGTTSALCLVGFGTTVLGLPQNAGTLRVSPTPPAFLLPISTTTALFTVPPQFEGTTVYIQALVTDGQHPAGAILTDATKVDFFTPLVLNGNTRQSSNNIMSIDPNAHTLKQTLTNYRGGSFMFTPDRQRVYVADVETLLNRLTRYDVVNGQLVFNKTIPLSGGTRYHGAVTRDGSTMYVPVHDGIAVIDLNTDTEVRKIPTTYVGNASSIFTGPLDCAITPNGRKLYVCYGQSLPTWPAKNHVGVFDLSQTPPTETLIPVSTAGAVTLLSNLSTHNAIDISADGLTVAVVEFAFTPGAFAAGFQNGGYICLIDTLADIEIGAVLTNGFSATEVAIDRNGRNVYSVHVDGNGNAEAVRVNVDRRTTNPYTISHVYNASTTPGFPAVGAGHGIDVLPDGSTLFVSIEETASTNPTMVRIDTATNLINAPGLTLASLPAHLQVQQ